MRPSLSLAVVLLFIGVAGGLLSFRVAQKRDVYIRTWSETRMVVMALGLSDLAVSTEARYTRHPAVSDSLVPFMDHPGGLEHFPSGSFYHPVP